MRLSEMREIIKLHQDGLNLIQEVVPNTTNIKLINVIQTNKSIDELYIIDPLKQEIDELKGITNIYSARIDEIIVSKNDASSFMKWLQTLNNSCQTILDVADAILPEMSENTICIKLAPTSNIGDLAKVTKDLNFILDTTSSIFKEDKKQADSAFVGLEAGSDWLYITLAGSAFILFFNNLVDAVSNVAVKCIQFKKSLIELEKAQLDNEHKKYCNGMLKNMESFQRQSYLHEVNQLIEGKTITPETRDKLFLSADKLSELLIKGNEIHPSLTAPKERQEQSNSTTKALSTAIKEFKMLSEAVENNGEEEQPDENATSSDE